MLSSNIPIPQIFQQIPMTARCATRYKTLPISLFVEAESPLDLRGFPYVIAKKRAKTIKVTTATTMVGVEGMRDCLRRDRIGAMNGRSRVDVGVIAAPYLAATHQVNYCSRFVV